MFVEMMSIRVVLAVGDSAYSAFVVSRKVVFAGSQCAESSTEASIKGAYS